MKLNWRFEAFQLALIAALFLVAVMCWSHVPDRMPVHWSLQGEADGYGDRATGLLLLPGITLGMYVLLLVLPWFDPGRKNYVNFATAYSAIRLSLVVFFAVIYIATVLVALGYKVDITRVVCAAVGLLFVVLGNFMGKIRPNWFVGVRTPWTLSSNLSWTKTHRLGGWLFIVMGALIAALGVIQTVWMFVLTLGTCFAAVAWMLVYSYIVYRNDPQRVTPTRPAPDVS